MGLTGAEYWFVLSLLYLRSARNRLKALSGCAAGLKGGEGDVVDV